MRLGVCLRRHTDKQTLHVGGIQYHCGEAVVQGGGRPAPGLHPPTPASANHHHRVSRSNAMSRERLTGAG